MAERLFDTLLIERMHNLELPTWVDDYVYAQLNDIFTKTFLFSSLTRKIQRLRTGLLLKDIAAHLQQPNFGNRKLYIYSTHDTQLVVFLNALGVYNDLAPPFGASVMLEVHQRTPTDKPYLRLFYLNQTETNTPHELRLNDCINDDSDLITTNPRSSNRLHQHSEVGVCTVSKWIHSIEGLIPGDWEKECDNVSVDELDGEYSRLWLLYRKTYPFLFCFG